MPTGHWQFGYLPMVPGAHFFSGSGRRQAPLTNVVPCGQQFGGVPMGRLRGHSGGGVTSRERHLPFTKVVPRGQQLG